MMVGRSVGRSSHSRGVATVRGWAVGVTVTMCTGTTVTASAMSRGARSLPGHSVGSEPPLRLDDRDDIRGLHRSVRSASVRPSAMSVGCVRLKSQTSDGVCGVDGDERFLFVAAVVVAEAGDSAQQRCCCSRCRRRQFGRT